MSEPVTVWRGTTTTDEDGNPIKADPMPVFTTSGLYAPGHPSEANSEGRHALIEQAAVYIRTTETLDIRSTDLIEVRSPVAANAPVADRRPHLKGIDGIVRDWVSRTGVRCGYQINLKEVTG